MKIIKDVMKLNVTAVGSFRADKTLTNKPRLLIATVGDPSVRCDILRCAPWLRNTANYSNIYISPDMTQKERKTNIKLREELASRMQAREHSLVIGGG